MTFDPVQNNELGRLLEDLESLGLGDGGQNTQRVQQVARPVFEAIENYDEVVAREGGINTREINPHIRDVTTTLISSAPFLLVVLGLGIAAAILMHPVFLFLMFIVGIWVVYGVHESGFGCDFDALIESGGIRVDAKLNQANFTKPLLGPDIDALPQGTDKKLYEKLVDLCRIEMEGEEDQDALI